MSVMAHLAHGSIRLGQNARSVLTSATVDPLSLPTGRYTVHGRLGDVVNSVAPVPVLTNSPFETENIWPASMAYTMLIDVEAVHMGSGILGSTAMRTAMGGTHLRRVEVSVIIHTLEGDVRYWNSDPLTQIRIQRRNGVLRWMSSEHVVPDAAGDGVVSTAWTHWIGLTPNVNNTRSVFPRVVDSEYIIDISLSTNFEIANYNPVYGLQLINKESASNMTRTLANFDGIVTITLNAIASTGAVIFSVPTLQQPKWINSYTPTSGKKGRIILDYSGSLVTAMGVDLPGDTTAY